MLAATLRVNRRLERDNLQVKPAVPSALAWGTKKMSPEPPLPALTGRPCRRMTPLPEDQRPAMARSVEVLPAPLAPAISSDCPGDTCAKAHQKAVDFRCQAWNPSTPHCKWVLHEYRGGSTSF